MEKKSYGKLADKILARIDASRGGWVSIPFGRMYRKKFGWRELAAADKLVAAGVLERIPTTGGPEPIRSRARWMNNANIGVHSEARFKRVKRA